MINTKEFTRQYNQMLQFITDWQKDNVIKDLYENNIKFKMDFKKFFDESDIDNEIKQDFLKYL